MPRPTREPASTSATDARLQSLDGKIDSLTAAVERMADGLRVLLDVMTDIREDVQWGVLNDKFGCESRHVVQVTSLAKDPCSPEWSAKLNSVPAAELQRLRAASTGQDEPSPAKPAHQNELF